MKTHTSRRLMDHKLDAAPWHAAAGEQRGSLALAHKLWQIGHWSMRLSDHAVTWSDEVYKILGVSRDRYSPDAVSAISFIHPDDRKIFVTSYQAAMQDGTPFEFALRIIRADGEIRYIKLRGVTLAEPDDNAPCIFGAVVDVTDERNLEQFLRAENLRLQEIAYVDALTLIPNRRRFDEALNSEWLRAIRGETAISLIMVDIDQFKRFNDFYGHLAGDACLRIVASTLAAILRRPADLVARYGGEEFALLLPGTPGPGATKLAHAVRTAINGLQLSHAGNSCCGAVVTVSLGVSTLYPQPGPSREGWLDLINEADAMLYKAKRTGRNRVVSPNNFATAGAAFSKDQQASLASPAFVNELAASGAGQSLARLQNLPRS